MTMYASIKMNHSLEKPYSYKELIKQSIHLHKYKGNIITLSLYIQVFT